MTSHCQLATYRSGDVLLFCQSLPQQWHCCTPVGTDETNMPTKEQEARGKRADLEQIQDRFEWIFATQRLRWSGRRGKKRPQKTGRSSPDAKKRSSKDIERDGSSLCWLSAQVGRELLLFQLSQIFETELSVSLFKFFRENRSLSFLILRYERYLIKWRLKSFHSLWPSKSDKECP